MNLQDKSCVPCKGGIPPLTRKEFGPMLSEVNSAWEVIDNKKLRRTFEFPAFMDAIAFVNKIADIAEREGHHPDIQIHYKQVIIELWTFKIDGLFDNDFILATKIDELTN
ncbi:MAG: 4a-hydroxytetrahydrobiopterin dehydratase [bacterium]|nr:4a-hydroxytetrahydrobiopterin dehydratase [bacterium]